MAAKRISKSVIDWTALSERVPANQKTQFLNFKSKSDSYLRRMIANPAEPPKLDWTKYKQNIALVGMVDTFQKCYDGLKVPYPDNKKCSELENLKKAVENDVANYKKDSEARIAKYQCEVATIEGLVPYEQMTMEEFCEAHPELAIDAIKNPTFWPHSPDEQLDYKPTDPLLAAKAH